MRWKRSRQAEKEDRDLEKRLRREVADELPADLPPEVAARVRRRVKAVIAEELAAAAQERAPRRLPEARGTEPQEETFQRFNLHFRIQHMILFTSVILLIVTGLPLKFPESPLGGLVWLLGGLDTSRILHRVGGSGLVVVGIYHMAYTLFHPDGRRDFWLLLPRVKDVLDAIQAIRFNLGLASSKPRFDRFSYIEKFDYWAVYWGCVIMIGSGALLWFETLSLTYLPKFMLDIAKEAHSDEALLATLAIVIWHFYNVHFNPSRFPGSTTWWTGRISKHEMIEEHPLEYERIMAARKVLEGGEDRAEKKGSAAAGS